MVSKKLKLLVALCTFVSAGAFAQTESGNSGYMSGGYSIYDSTVIPNKRMGQQNEFWNNSYAFPAKPRNMWEIGVSTGLFNVSGDVPTKVFTAPNYAFHIRKAFGYVFSLRLQYLGGKGDGLNWKAAQNFYKNPAYSTQVIMHLTAPIPVLSLIQIHNATRSTVETWFITATEQKLKTFLSRELLR